MDYSLGKHVTSVGRWVAVVVVLLSPALLVAAGDKDALSKRQGSAGVGKSRDVQQVQFGGPSVEIPHPSVEGLVEFPADGPLVGDMIDISGSPLMESPVMESMESQMGASPIYSAPAESPIYSDSPVYNESPVYGDAIPESFPYSQQAAEGSAPLFSTGSWLWNGRWYLNSDFVVLKKDNPSSRLVAFDSATAIQTAQGGVVIDRALWANTESPEFESGARITFGKFLGRDAARRDHMLDFTFFGFFDWVAQAEIVAPGAVFSGLTVSDLRRFSPTQATTIPGFTNTDRQSYRYSSDLNSFEVNYRIRTRPGRDQMAVHPSGTWTRHASSGQLRGFSAGLRALSINEGFLVQAFTETDRVGMYRIKTGNDMIGPQLGLDLIETHDFWYWGFRSQAGTLLNFADRHSVIETQSGVTTEIITARAQQNEEEQLTFLGQVGLYGAMQLRPNLSIRCAYDFMMLAGVALAPDNAHLSNGFPGFSTGGTALYHGASFGFESQF